MSGQGKHPLNSSSFQHLPGPERKTMYYSVSDEIVSFLWNVTCFINSFCDPPIVLNPMANNTVFQTNLAFSGHGEVSCFTEPCH